jgi:peptidoglycan/xylan/chitin deacetylase (PgdA/CDA1 family)
VNGDATGIEYSKAQLIENVLNGVAEKKTSIVLMHDSQSKKTTVESLPGLLEKLISGGAQILSLNKDVTPIQMIKADSIN